MSVCFAIAGLVVPTIPGQWRFGIFLVAMVGLAISCVGWYCAHQSEKKKNRFMQRKEQPAVVAASQDERVGFLQFDKMEYHQNGFAADKPFPITVWFANRGSFPAYSAQGFALLVNMPSIYSGVDAGIRRRVRRIVRKEWETQPESQVAVGGSIFFPTSVTLSQEEIDRVLSSQSRIYLLTFARWKTASGKRVFPEWDECTWLEAPQSASFNSLELKWRRCDAAPIPAQVNAAEIQALDDLREEGRELFTPSTGQLPSVDRVNRYLEKAQLYLRTNIPEYLNEFEQMEKEPRPIGNDPNPDSPLWFNNLERQVEGRRLAAIISFLDLIREELYYKLP